MSSSFLRTAAGSALIAALAPLAGAQGSAEYLVTFEATWTAQTHPGAHVPSAHFSPLIGATHSAGYQVWTPGGIASPGMEQMAETGGTSALTAEINAAIGAGTALERVTGAALFNLPASTSTSFTVTTEHSLLSLVTMVAPSPDWFVGVHDLDLLQGGTWVDDLAVPLYAYDAGTDSGVALTSSNQNTNPQEPIALITGGPFTGTTPLGMFRFERLHSTLVYGDGNPAGSLALVSGSPQLGQNVTLALDDPTNQFSAAIPTFLALSGAPGIGFPGGLSLPGFGLGPVGTAGQLLVPATSVLLPGPLYSGAPSSTVLPIPNQVGLVGASLYLQGVLVDTLQLRVGLTRAIELSIGS